MPSPRNSNRSALRISEPPSHRRSFLIGVGLIFASSAAGWGALALGGALAPVYGKAALKIGACVYFLSWVPFGIGAYLSGREGIRYSRELLQKKLGSMHRRPARTTEGRARDAKDAEERRE